jgi:hypothetical protein
MVTIITSGERFYVHKVLLIEIACFRRKLQDSADAAADADVNAEATEEDSFEYNCFDAAIQLLAMWLCQRKVPITRSDIESCTDGDKLVANVETMCDVYRLAIDARMPDWVTAVIDAVATFPIDDLLFSRAL